MTDESDDIRDAEILPENPFADRPETRQAPPRFVNDSADDMGQDPGIRMLLPVGRSVWAIVAGYMALLSPIMCLTAPIALFCGIMALRDMKRNPELHGAGRAWFGIVVGAIGTIGFVFFVVMLIIGALADL